MSDLLTVVARNAADIENIEEYVAREQGGGETESGAPRVAGG
jgi:bacterioferritin B